MNILIDQKLARFPSEAEIEAVHSLYESAIRAHDQSALKYVHQHYLDRGTVSFKPLLNYVIRQYRLEATKYLIEVSSLSERDYIALFDTAFNSNNGEVLDLLLSQKSTTIGQETLNVCLFKAIKKTSGDLLNHHLLDVVAVLLKHGADSTYRPLNGKQLFERFDWDYAYAGGVIQNLMRFGFISGAQAREIRPPHDSPCFSAQEIESLEAIDVHLAQGPFNELMDKASDRVKQLIRCAHVPLSLIPGDTRASVTIFSLLQPQEINNQVKNYAEEQPCEFQQYLALTPYFHKQLEAIRERDSNEEMLNNLKEKLTPDAVIPHLNDFKEAAYHENPIEDLLWRINPNRPAISGGVDAQHRTQAPDPSTNCVTDPRRADGVEPSGGI